MGVFYDIQFASWLESRLESRLELAVAPGPRLDPTITVSSWPRWREKYSGRLPGDDGADYSAAQRGEPATTQDPEASWKKLVALLGAAIDRDVIVAQMAKLHIGRPGFDLTSCLAGIIKAQAEAKAQVMAAATRLAHSATAVQPARAGELNELRGTVQLLYALVHVPPGKDLLDMVTLALTERDQLRARVRELEQAKPG